MASKYKIDPMGAVRMNAKTMFLKNKSGDRARKYLTYKNKLKELGIILTNTPEVIFEIKMPDSWSLKKKHAMNGEPHQQKPDIDNLIKGLFDAVLKEDKQIYKVTAKKRWATEGSIII